MRTVRAWPVLLVCGVVGCSSGDSDKPSPTDGGTGLSLDATFAVDGGVNLNVDSGPLPGGHIKCDMGGWYRCDELQLQCCSAKNLCFDPIQEPTFCP